MDTMIRDWFMENKKYFDDAHSLTKEGHDWLLADRRREIDCEYDRLYSSVTGTEEDWYDNKEECKNKWENRSEEVKAKVEDILRRDKIWQNLDYHTYLVLREEALTGVPNVDYSKVVFYLKDMISKFNSQTTECLSILTQLNAVGKELELKCNFMANSSDLVEIEKLEDEIRTLASGFYLDLHGYFNINGNKQTKGSVK